MKLTRYNFDTEYTEGLLTSTHFDAPLYTIERPWIPYELFRGGKPRESCVPNGTYQLDAHRRPSGATVPILSNPDLGVYMYAEHRRRELGRYLILIHSGNTVAHVVGCIAPGVRRLRPGFVANSRDAMRQVWDAFVDGDTTLEIVSKETEEIV